MANFTDHSRQAGLLLLLACSGAPGTVYGFSLGELQVRSFIGQPFHARIPLKVSGDEVLPEPRCAHIHSENRELPGIGAASLQVVQRGASTELLIRSFERVSEPMIAFTLDLQCGRVQFQREFIVMLEPVPVQELPVMSQSPRVDVPASVPVAVKLRNARTLRSDASLNDLATRYYPPNSRNHARYLRRLVAANPQFGGPDTVMPQGTPVVLPKRPRQAAPVRVASAAGGQDQGARLTLGDAQGQVPAQKVTPPTQAMRIEELEHQLALMAELNSKMQMEMTALQQRLAQMQPASVPAVLALPVSTQPVRASSPVAASVPVRVKAKSSSSSLLWWAVPGAAFAGLLAYWIWRVRRQREEEFWDNDNITRQGLPGREPMPVQAGKPPRTMESGEHTEISIFRNSALHGGIEVMDESIPLVERAASLVMQGEVSDAIDLLYRGIDEDPSEAERWLMLFRLFRQRAMKTEYNQLAKRFVAGKYDPDDWELVRNLGSRLDPGNPLYAGESGSPRQSQQEEGESPDAAFAAALAPPVTLKPVKSSKPVDAPMMDFFGDMNRHGELEKVDINPPPTLQLELPPLPTSVIEVDPDELNDVERLARGVKKTSGG